MYIVCSRLTKVSFRCTKYENTGEKNESYKSNDGNRVRFGLRLRLGGRNLSPEHNSANDATNDANSDNDAHFDSFRSNQNQSAQTHPRKKKNEKKSRQKRRPSRGKNQNSNHRNDNDAAIKKIIFKLREMPVYHAGIFIWN